MKLGTMLRDVSGSLFRRPVTEKYPFERREAPQHLRSLVKWTPEGCVGCSLCETDCPAQAIDFIILDRQAKRYVFTYHADRCTFCAQCVISCRQHCVKLECDQWELAALDKSPFELHYGDPADVEKALAGKTK